MALNELGLGFVFDAKDLASGVMDRVGNKLTDVAGKGSIAGRSMMKSMGEFSVGLSMLGVGLGGLALLGTATAEAKDFSKAINLVRTEVDEATFSNTAMRDIAVDLGKTFGKLPKDEAEAMYKAVALGANTAEKANALMTAGNQLAVAGNSELKVTMDALGGAINAYGLQASDASMVSDAFFTAMKNGNTTVQDLAASVGRVSAGAHAMGISVQEVLGSVSVMTNKGIQASEAVSYLHGALANIVHPSHDAMIEARRLGIQFNASAVRAQGFQAFLHSITDNAKFGAKSLEKLFTSVEGSQAMAMLAGDMKSVDDVMSKMKNGAGATKAGFDIMSEGLDFQSQKLKANFSALKIRIGEFLEPLAGRGLGLINRAISAFSNLPAPILKMVVTFASAASATIAFLGAILMAKAAIGLVAMGLGAAGVTLGGFLATLAPVILLVGAAAGVFYAFRFAVENNVGPIGSFVRDMVSKVSLAYHALVELFSTGGFSKALFDELDTADNQGVKNFAIRVYLTVERIKNAFEQFAGGVQSIFSTMGPTWDRFVAVVLRLAHAFGFLTEGNGIQESVASWNSFANAGFSAGQSVGKAIDFVVRVATALMEIVDGIGIGWGKVAPSLAPVRSAFAAIGDGLERVAAALGISDPTGATSSWTKIGQVLGSVAGIVVDVLAAAFESAAGVIGGVLTQIAGMVKIVKGIFTGDWAMVWDGAKDVVFGLLQAVSAMAFGTVNVIAKLIDGIGKAFGKDLGFSDKLMGVKADLDKAMAQSLGVGTPGQAVAQTGIAGAVNNIGAPKNAMADRQDATLDALTRPALAFSKQPPPSVNVTVPVLIDGEKVAEAVARHQATADDRSGVPQSPGG